MAAVLSGTTQRVRPIAMTATAVIAGLVPIMWGGGTGSDVMQRIAAPMIGGMLTATDTLAAGLAGHLRLGVAHPGGTQESARQWIKKQLSRRGAEDAESEQIKEFNIKETLIYSCTPLSRLRERGWGRGRREEAAYISAHSLSLSLSRKRERVIYFLQNRLIRASLRMSNKMISEKH